MKKVAVIGHYAHRLEYLDGQTIKTKIVTNELCKEYGESEIIQFDTHGEVKTLLRAPLYVWRAMKDTQNIIILPAQNGLRIFGRLLPFFKFFFKKRKIHYVVIGGWLSKMLEKQKGLAKSLKKFDGIYVETNTMKHALMAQGFKNIFVMPNCKELTPISISELAYQNEAPYRLCTFSRVIKEKGIEDAIDAVKSINLEFGKTIYSLDIYGQVDPSQKEWFDNLKTELPNHIKYCGLVPYYKSVEVLKNYFALLFPTRFYTEGIPGTIIDAYAAGIPVISARWQSFNDIIDDHATGIPGTIIDAYAAGIPVISSRWQSFNDVVDEHVTGIGYEFNNIDDLKQKLLDIEKCTEGVNALKLNCLRKSKQYLPNEAIKIIVKQLL